MCFTAPLKWYKTFSSLFGSHDNAETRQLIITVNKSIIFTYYEEAKARNQQIQRVVLQMEIRVTYNSLAHMSQRLTK